MNRATPTEMRKVLEIVEMYKKAGIPFIPIPVLSDEDNGRLVALAQHRLGLLLATAELPQFPECECIHVQELYPGIWKGRTRSGSWSICECSDGVRCGSTAAFATHLIASDYADYVFDPESPGGKRWVGVHKGG